MPQPKKPKARGSAMQARKHIAVKLTSEELKELRRIALDRNSSSVDVVTGAIRDFIRKQQSPRK
jgi:hypothetical protein